MVGVMDMCELFSTTTPDGKLRTWEVERLWGLAEDLPEQVWPLSALEHQLDEVVWFDASPEAKFDKPTARAVAAHSERIYSADLTYPILLSAAGEVMDGMHRLAKAWMTGEPTIKVKQFQVDPEPDDVE